MTVTLMAMMMIMVMMVMVAMHIVAVSMMATSDPFIAFFSLFLYLHANKVKKSIYLSILIGV